MMFQQIKVVLLSIISLFRRALCCFSRRRKLSHAEHHTLQAVSVVVEPRTPNNTQGTGQYKERDWNSWDDSPRTVEEHIEQYRNRIANPPTPANEAPEPDFFSELTPDIKPQTKYYLNNDTTPTEANFSRLQAQTDVPITMNADLEDWVDDNEGGWEALDSEQAKQLIREKRREMRSNRQNTAKANNYGNAAARQVPSGHKSGIGATRINDAQLSA